jgi:hypothetical protein
LIRAIDCWLVKTTALNNLTDLNGFALATDIVDIYSGAASGKYPDPSGAGIAGNVSERAEIVL